MMCKNDFVSRYPGVVHGTAVRSQDGERLGKVAALDEDSFVVEKGIFFPKDFLFRYDDIEGFRDGELIVGKGRADLSDWRDESYQGWSDVDDINSRRLNASPREEFRQKYPDWDTEEVRVPVREEELQAHKTVRQSGEVRLRKIVHTELKQFTVPVMREEVEIERVPASEATPLDPAAEGDAFKEETITVPVMEEEVTITKRPVIKEEVRVHKKRSEEERTVSDQVRKEEVQVDEDAPRKRRKLG